MNLFSTLLAPLALLFHGTADKPARDAGLVVPESAAPALDPGGEPGHLLLLDPADGQVRDQVRIEQRMTIRITPRPGASRPDMLFYLPDDEVGPRFIERKVGKCLAVSGIAGVQAGGASKLILFMRDQRIVSASLERACRARDFYSGFYLARSNDGQLCVDRDMLLSRSGANCKLTRLRQLIEVEE